MINPVGALQYRFLKLSASDWWVDLARNVKGCHRCDLPVMYSKKNVAFTHAVGHTEHGRLANVMIISNCVIVAEVLSGSLPLFWCLVGAFLGGMALAMCGKLDLKEAAKQRYAVRIIYAFNPIMLKKKS